MKKKKQSYYFLLRELVHSDRGLPQDLCTGRSHSLSECYSENKASNK